AVVEVLPQALRFLRQRVEGARQLRAPAQRQQVAIIQRPVDRDLQEGARLRVERSHALRGDRERGGRPETVARHHDQAGRLRRAVDDARDAGLLLAPGVPARAIGLLLALGRLLAGGSRQRRFIVPEPGIEAALERYRQQARAGLVLDGEAGTR